jgi:hypothetical protein
MATSSKVVFKLDDLKEKALVALHTRIQAAIEELDNYSEDRWEDYVEDWRTEQEKRVSHLFSRLGGKDLSNEELSSFRVKSLDRQTWDYKAQAAQAIVNRLQAQEASIRAKSESLVPDEDGNIALTKTQLSEFFGL